MKLDITVLRYLSREDWRILMAIEMGMKNHDLVPTDLIVKIGRLHRGGTFKAISNLHKHKLIYHENKIYDGYRLTYLGYDFLCLKAMSMRNTVVSVGTRIGVGKESDIFACAGPDDQSYVLKLARLGRISFRNIKTKRDYMLKRKSASWLYMSRLAAFREFSYMKILHEHGLPIPAPRDWSRHGVLMDRVDGFNLSAVNEIENVEEVYVELMKIILLFASFGLIHCDFNEFNIMTSRDGKITVIDFPQMVSIQHENAQWYFERDVECIVTYFARKFKFTSEWKAKWEDVKAGDVRLDVLVKASGVDSSVGMPTEDGEGAEQEVPDDLNALGEEGGNVEESGSNNNNNNNNEEEVEKKEEEKNDDQVKVESEEKDGTKEEEVESTEDEENTSRKGKKGEDRSARDVVRNNVRRELQKNRDQQKFQKTKRQGKREKNREGMRKVKEYVKGGGW